MTIVYRVVFQSEAGLCERPAIDFQCADDDRARKLVRQYLGAEDIELWRGGHLVEIFPRQSVPGIMTMGLHDSADARHAHADAQLPGRFILWT